MKSRKSRKKNYKLKKNNAVRYGNEIRGILALALGVLMMLSFYVKDSVGIFGTAIREVSLGMLGAPAFLLPPLIILYAAVLIFAHDKIDLKNRPLYVLALLLLVSAIINTGQYKPENYDGLAPAKALKMFFANGNDLAGGGVLGGIVSMPFLFTFKVLGTIIILTALSLVDIILLTNSSIAGFARNLRNIFKRGKKGVKPAGGSDGRSEDDEAQPAIIEENGNISLRFDKKPKIIDFRIEKSAKELKGKELKDMMENRPEKADYPEDEGNPGHIGGNESGLMNNPGYGAGNGPENEYGKRHGHESKLARDRGHDPGQGHGGVPGGSEAGRNVEVPWGMPSVRVLGEHGETGTRPAKDADLDGGGKGGPGLTEIIIKAGAKTAGTAKYACPPYDLLIEGEDHGTGSKNLRNQVLEGARKLEETLGSFGVSAKVVNVTRGPAITRYELQPSAGVKVSRIVNLSDDIALNLAAPAIRIEAPIPGKAAVGIEVPNKEINMVRIRDVVESPEFIQHPSKLAFAVGKDVSGEIIIIDIARMPHLLIAGATGSGKSVCINSLIVSLLYKASPDEVKLLMIDTKVVELGVYNGVPHLLIPVVTEPKKAAGALNWAVQEMVTRYKAFADKGVRDIKGYNELVARTGEQPPMAQIVIIIDELADLMMVAPGEVEDSICRLAQMARAAGMHLVIATQRPSVDVITGIIKANIPSRISFAVSSQVDSRTILDMAGAEKLLGRGDMLLHPLGRAKPIRVQGANITDAEVEKVVEYVKNQAAASYDSAIIDEINNGESSYGGDPNDIDELLPKAIELVVDAGQASVSLIQRKFKVGYARAARIVDQMEARGIVGGSEGSKPRQVLVTKQQWREMQMSDEI